MKKFLVLFMVMCSFSMGYGLTLISPSNGSLVTDSAVNFRWTPENCSTYQILIYEKLSSNSYMFLGQGYPSSNQSSAQLRSGVLSVNKTYVWVMRSMTCTNGMCVWGPWSNVFSFSTGYPNVVNNPGTVTNAGGTNTNTGGATSGSGQSYAVISQKSESQIDNEVMQKFGVTFKVIDRNWTKDEKAGCYSLMDNIETNFVKLTRFVCRQTWWRSSGVLGYAYIGRPEVYLLDSTCRSRTSMVNTYAHEMTHVFQGPFRNIADEWGYKFHGRSSNSQSRVSGSPTSYGNTNVVEDMAESVRYYIFNPSNLKNGYSSRYDFIKNKVMRGKEYNGNEVY